MSFWKLVENSPEWVGVFTTALFAIVTTAIIYGQYRAMEAQVRVMVWQGKNSARHERAQNRLLRLQHEHEWVWRKNQEREQLLKLGNKLHLAVGCLVNQPPSSLEPEFWGDIQNTVYELDRRLRVLDIATFSGEHDQWFFPLKDYVEAIKKTATDEPDIQYASPRTKNELQGIEKRCDPLMTFLEIEKAIRMEFAVFKNKWDTELPA